MDCSDCLGASWWKACAKKYFLSEWKICRHFREILADLILSKAWEKKVKESVENVYNISVEEFVQCKLLSSKPCANDIIFSIIPYAFNTTLTIYFIDLSDDFQVFLFRKCRKKA
eukprot:TRINITY_DN13511_c0_g1_i1.p3 TRINITY_DN13511_c0_g1~~TRINITY_DN13511_c0_g1_i1.p3  ORF type:complete len:114 (-),score=15.69 TRINITY_DN13511_c0_g1_i1:617-958(-)